MTSTRVFLDSDVVISSSLSKTGSAYHILTSSKFTLFISNYSKDELERVAERTDLNIRSINKIVAKSTEIHVIKKSLKLLKEGYREYVRDENDAHIVAGAAEVKASFLLTYNTKDFRKDKINAKLGILVLKPGNFLQYLRSLDKF